MWIPQTTTRAEVTEPRPAEGEDFDLFVVGGGINGTGIARDAAGRGLKVALVERDDLASWTSSASSKLIHGGLRYLEQYAFRLVREGLAEREVLLKIAPHLVQPLRFVMPHQASLRPAWMIRSGLFLYDWLGGRRLTLPGSRGLELSREGGDGLKPSFRKGFSYYDCRVDDARLVIANARDAAARGAVIRTRTECVGARRRGTGWDIETIDRRAGTRRHHRARILVNAAGPWAASFVAEAAALPAKHRIRLVKGSHVVVPRLHDGEHALLLQNADRRIIFVIPFEERFSLIGTTDVALAGPPGPVAISQDEIAYLQRAVGLYLEKSFRAEEIVWSYAGIRPLHDDGSANPSAVTRDYVLELDGGPETAPLLSVFGGKVTTYRRLAEHALERLRPFLPRWAPAWTATAPLPGGDLGPGGLARFTADLIARRPGLPPEWLRGLAARHGSRAAEVLGDARLPADLGRDFGGGLREREAEYFLRHEWARSAEDILWRRSKAGLHLPPDGVAAFEAWLDGAREAEKIAPNESNRVGASPSA